MSIQIQFRRGTASQWTAADTVLASGEMGIETDTKKFKIGDGTTAWTSLAYGGLQGEAGLTEGEPIMIRDTFTAGGTIAAGDAVYVDSAGKIQKGTSDLSKGTNTNNASSGGTVSASTGLFVEWLTDAKFIVSHHDTQSGQYTSRVRCGSVSGTAITYGDWVTIATAGAPCLIYSIKRLSDTSFAILYCDANGYHAVRAGSVSGTTISVGTLENSYSSTMVGTPQIGWLERLDDTHFVALNYSATTTARLNVYSVSGTTLTKGTDSDITVNTTKYSGSLCVLDSTHFCFPYSASTTTTNVVCCSVSGTTITKGTAVSILSDTYFAPYGCFVWALSSTTFACVFTTVVDSTHLKFCVGSVSGTTITYGSVVTNSTATTAQSGTAKLYFNKMSTTAWNVISVDDKYVITINAAADPLTIIETKDLSASCGYIFPLGTNALMAVKNNATGYLVTASIVTVSLSGAIIGTALTIVTDAADPGLNPCWVGANPSSTLAILEMFLSGSPTGSDAYLQTSVCLTVSTTGGTTAAGIALEASTLDNDCDVALCAASLDLWSGLTPGAVYYITASGGLSTTAQTINGVSSRLGTAATTSKILVNTARTDPKQLY